MIPKNKLKQLRVASGLSQKSLADKLFISQNAYCLIEKGTTKLDESRIKQLGKIFNVPLSELISESNPQNGIFENNSTAGPDDSKLNYYLVEQLVDQLSKKDDLILKLSSQVDFLLKDMHKSNEQKL
ncbi:DNA-binding transcriptional regulator, XRE-family HTH domain [Mucilaginibacter mallensis]|uniref:DNA-binding transcriptional regulator, XRE-family HTH domain n=1 Tax=Mucilaginibacter mallensis TaxID=652787 RepID=A0A1H1YWB7_MUCMA|nr:helix-turn-helix transcriptional regulator [Mucilaginibacter mallensis]SDT25637.1 DNA-binding transcriptional regulator, XRE-family HTH domain [Mucilaginibacter mallensis]